MNTNTKHNYPLLSESSRLWEMEAQCYENDALIDLNTVVADDNDKECVRPLQFFENINLVPDVKYTAEQLRHSWLIRNKIDSIREAKRIQIQRKIDEICLNTEKNCDIVHSTFLLLLDRSDLFEFFDTISILNLGLVCSDFYNKIYKNPQIYMRILKRLFISVPNIYDINSQNLVTNKYHEYIWFSAYGINNWPRQFARKIFFYLFVTNYLEYDLKDKNSKADTRIKPVFANPFAKADMDKFLTDVQTFEKCFPHLKFEYESSQKNSYPFQSDRYLDIINKTTSYYTDIKMQQAFESLFDKKNTLQSLNPGSKNVLNLLLRWSGYMDAALHTFVNDCRTKNIGNNFQNSLRSYKKAIKDIDLSLTIMTYHNKRYYNYNSEQQILSKDKDHKIKKYLKMRERIVKGHPPVIECMDFRNVMSYFDNLRAHATNSKGRAIKGYSALKMLSSLYLVNNMLTDITVTYQDKSIVLPPSILYTNKIQIYCFQGELKSKWGAETKPIYEWVDSAYIQDNILYPTEQFATYESVFTVFFEMLQQDVIGCLQTVEDLTKVCVLCGSSHHEKTHNIKWCRDRFDPKFKKLHTSDLSAIKTNGKRKATSSSPFVKKKKKNDKVEKKNK